MKPEFYNFIVVGAGTAGLTASIIAARNGFSVVVLEKGSKAGPRPRGEGINHASIVDEVAGMNYLQEHSFKMSGGAVYHSPGDLESFRLPGKQPNYFFEWREFIDRLVEVAKDSGVKILLNSEVIKPLENENNECIGVEYKDKEGKLQKVHGNAVLACDGHTSTIGSAYNIPYDKMNCKMMKCLISNANIDIEKTPDLQFYFIGNGDLDFSPKFPQCVVYGFPIGGKKMEVGIMLRMTQAVNMKTVEIPSDEEIWRVWEILKESYPGWSEYFKGATIEVEELTGLSNVGLVKDVVPRPGVVLIGDAAGFVDPFGSSGIIFGMSMAKSWVDSISKQLREISGSENVDEFKLELWTSENIKKYTKEFHKTKFYKKIKTSYAIIGKFEWLIFKKFRTSEKINKHWGLIHNLLKLA